MQFYASRKRLLTAILIAICAVGGGVIIYIKQTGDGAEKVMQNPDIEKRILNIPLPNEATQSEFIFLNVTVKALPRGGKLTLHDMDGNILGTAAPFGSEGNLDPLTFVIPIPAHFAQNQNLQLQAQIFLPNEGRGRGPSDDELILIKVALP
jgi:hypothetical protein